MLTLYPQKFMAPEGSGDGSDLKSGTDLANHQPSMFEGSGMFQSMKQYLDPPVVKDEKSVQDPPVGSGEPPKDPLEGNLEVLGKPALIEEVKKNQRFVSEHKARIDEMTTKLTELETKAKAGGDPELAKVIQDLSVDFKGTYERIRKQYKLPEANEIIAQFQGGDIGSRIKQFQENELRSKIEKKFNLTAGEFEFDPKEAAIAGTPSWEWNDLTDRKRTELLTSETAKRTAEEQNLRKVDAQQIEDKKFIAEKYYNGNMEEVEGLVKSMNEVIAKIATGEATPDQHPLAMRNLIRGFKHEELLAKAVAENTKSIMAEFAKHKLYLPDTSNMPTDLSNVQSAGTPDGIELFSKEALKLSPMLRSMNI